MIRIFFLTTSFILIGVILNASNNYKDSIVIFTNIKEFKLHKKNNDILRTYNIKFTFYEMHLDTTDNNTLMFLDSLCDLILRDSTGSRYEVGIHLSLKHSSENSNNYSHMHQEIINYLVNRGVNPDKLIGNNYLDKQPLVSPINSDFSNEEFVEKDLLINRRVEIKVIDVSPKSN